ncbi:MAG: amino acid adenylation domain-containing protein [Chitinophagaceae bacterium]|jgi:non-ribosomal peptide synthetase-like protein|nr:amino acid adenylation domain-containing protein [Chitinophagaceae bacterium]
MDTKTKSIVLGADRPDIIKDETLADIFRSSVKNFPDKVALIFGAKSLTYAQLDKWSDAVAAFLQSKNIGKGKFVGLWLPRSIELHVAILGIVKSGAAYIPLDREMPAERVETVLTEVGASAYFSDTNLKIACPVLSVPNQTNDAVQLTDSPAPDGYAYVLYTSGSTGKPKGIPITQKQIAHLVRSEQTILNIQPADKVYQGFSVSFDMWCEETWISYFAGAMLWVADAVTAKAIDELSSVLKKEAITILHAVPSLLAVMEEDIPSLRLVNAGGEACTTQVLDKWAKPSVKFINSYGPTETTVTATMAFLKKGDAIDIGKPLPNYNLAVIDEQFNILPFGEKGELIITGPGVSNGYINRPDLTNGKFRPITDAMAGLPGDRYYCTGDAVIIHTDGRVEFLGRIDDQVKLRGYRMELGEIETQLNALAGVTTAAAALKKDNNNQDELIGYVTCENDFDENFARAELAKVLPPYMVPLSIVRLKEMPRLPSGKINRKALPTPDVLLHVPKTDDVIIDVNAPVETKTLQALRKTFPGKNIQPSSDFFTDLGGHSLLAATFVSILRKEAAMPYASLKDIYTARPLNSLINLWETAEKKQDKNRQERYFHKTSNLKYWACAVAQFVALLLVYGLFAVQIFIPYLGYYYVVSLSESGVGNVHYALVVALGMFCIIPPLLVFFSFAAKWLLIGKMKEGDYPLWGWFYFRWWLVNTIQRLIPTQFMNGTPIYPVYLKLMGVKVARNAQLGSINIGAEDLITIGEDVSISSQVILNNAVVEDGFLKLRKITIGDHAYVGSSAVVAGDTVIEEWGELQDLSFLQSGNTIKKAEVWKGSPAQFVEKRQPEELPQPLEVSKFTIKRFELYFSVLLIIFPLTVLIPLIPLLLMINWLDNNSADYNFNYLIYTPVLSIVYIGLFVLETILLSRLLLYKIKPGKYPLYSFVYIRKWLSDQLISMSLIVVHPIFATVYVTSFFRALGAKIGKNTEISTASSVTHPMLEIGKESFIADAVTLGEADVRAQQLIIEKTIVGDRSFVGNSALIPQGYALPDDMLIGVLSVPPTQQQLKNENAKDWFGSPSIALPKRQDSGDFPAGLTVNPSVGRRILRGVVEFIRIILPETIVICCSVLFIAYAHDLVKPSATYPLWQVMVLLPLYYLKFMGLPALLITVLLKWVVVGKYKKEQKPMWTHKVWRSEAITSTYEALAVPFFLEYLKGTPFLPMALRLFGVKIGKKVWLNTTDITEYDMVSIGNNTALNDDCGPQTHLFEDRVMKVGHVAIGSECSIGARSIILYDSVIGNNNKIQPLSLIMKGETLPDNQEWAGSPIKISG